MKKQSECIAMLFFVLLIATGHTFAQEKDDLNYSLTDNGNSVRLTTGTQEPKQSATLINSGWGTQIVNIFKIDGTVTEKRTGTFTISEGYHVIECFGILGEFSENEEYNKNYTLFLNAEKNKTYTIKIGNASYIDTVERKVFLRYPVPQVFDKNTSPMTEVGGLLNTLKLMPDTSDSYHLYYGKILPVNELSHISFKTGLSNYTLIGRTYDGYKIFSHSGNVLSKFNVFLKPGWYSFTEKYTPNPSQSVTNGFFFKALADQFIHQEKDEPLHADKPGFVKFRTNFVNDIQFLPDAKHGWIVGDDGLILSTKDGGDSWDYTDMKVYRGGTFLEALEMTSTNKSIKFNSVCFIDSLTGWIAGDNGVIIFTPDGGITWTNRTFSNRKDIDEILFIDNNEGFVSIRGDFYQTNSFLSYTNDGGKTWNEVDKTGYPGRYFLSHKSSLYRFAKTDKKPVIFDLAFSEDKGSSWQKVMSINPEQEMEKGLPAYIPYLIDIGIINTETIWVLTLLNIQYSLDKGLSWKSFDLLKSNDIDMSRFQGMEAIGFSDSNMGYCIGANGRILATTDGGENWVAQQNSSNEMLTKISCVGGKAWIIGKNGCLLITKDGGTSWKYINILDLLYNLAPKE